MLLELARVTIDKMDLIKKINIMKKIMIRILLLTRYFVNIFRKIIINNNFTRICAIYNILSMAGSSLSLISALTKYVKKHLLHSFKYKLNNDLR